MIFWPVKYLFITLKVDRLREYKIAFRGLREGRHPFEFMLDRVFFDCFEATAGTEGTVRAEVELIKSALLMEVKIKINGTVKTVCDRCLEDMDLNISGEMNLYIKQGSREEGNNDDFIVLAADEDILDLSTCLYETYMLNYPLRAVHPERACDERMRRVLGKYVTNEEHKSIDPRWNELKKLIDN